MAEEQQRYDGMTNIGFPAVRMSLLGGEDRLLTSEDVDIVRQLKPGTALLVSLRGPSAGSRYLLKAPLIHASRDPQSEIPLPDSTVSREHALFTKITGGYSISDEGSLNGTYVNMKQVEGNLPLHNGDIIMIGSFKMLYLTAPQESEGIIPDKVKAQE